jgi:hypothetical protein
MIPSLVGSLCATSARALQFASQGGSNPLIAFRRGGGCMFALVKTAGVSWLLYIAQLGTVISLMGRSRFPHFSLEGRG